MVNAPLIDAHHSTAFTYRCDIFVCKAGGQKSAGGKESPASVLANHLLARTGKSGVERFHFDDPISSCGKAVGPGIDTLERKRETVPGGCGGPSRN